VTAVAIAKVTAALQTRLEAAIGLSRVYVGAPVTEDVGDHSLAIFLFHVVPNQALQNERHWVRGPGDGAGPLVETDAIALDLRFLVSAFRSTSTGGGGGLADADELVTLGEVIRALHENPVIDGSQVPGQLVRITPEPYPVEEMSRVWGLLPQTKYRPSTSMVYLLSPVSVSLDPPLGGPRVLERTLRQGPFTELPAPDATTSNSG
jgi:Pvc16 N-terminal domain